ncbi:MAG TPA: flavodoxin family protein [Candidatus Nanoarchaeia archaeon]|nr:flavodoxin family protein [Candidatus Nanoarchaeia archaeon]
MKVLGISAGRNNSNTEILVKQTLMGAEQAGAEVELVRLHDLHLKPCTGCNQCTIDLFENGGPGGCFIKGDDYDWIDEKIMGCDGLVLGSPIYDKCPTGHLKTLNDRMSCGHDVAFRMIARDVHEKKAKKGPGPDPRAFKERVATVIAVGGSEWDTLALPILQMFCFPMNIKVLDQILANWIGLPGTILFRPELLERAFRSGRHLVESLETSVAQAEYIGPDDWICPMCHSKLFEFRTERKNTSAKCAMCGLKGIINVMDGKIVFEFTEEAKKRSCITLEGNFHHADDLRYRSLVPDPMYHEMPERLKKFKDYLTPSKPVRSRKHEVLT